MGAKEMAMEEKDLGTDAREMAMEANESAMDVKETAADVEEMYLIVKEMILDGNEMILDESEMILDGKEKIMFKNKNSLLKTQWKSPKVPKVIKTKGKIDLCAIHVVDQHPQCQGQRTSRSQKELSGVDLPDSLIVERRHSKM